MKKLVAVIWLSMMTAGTFAQGLISFLNSPLTLISAQIGGSTAPISGPVGSYYFALLISTSAANGFTFTGVYATNTSVPGRLDGGRGILAPNWPPGVPMFYEIAGWSSSLGPTFDASWLTNPPADFGMSAIALGVPSDPAGTLPSFLLFGGATGIQGFVIAAVPEPVPIALRTQDFVYKGINGTVTVAGYTGPGGAVTIPNTIDGLPVTSIGDYAFYGPHGLTTVVIPNTVTNIGNFAFLDSDLTEVTIPDSVITIGTMAFSASHLTGAIIPNGVATIGSAAFQDCTSLSSATIGATNIGKWAFMSSGLTNVILSNGVLSIGGSAFRYCYSLTSVTIPSSVVSLGELAFYQCGLTNVTIGEGLVSIGDGAFATCNHLKAVYFQGSAPSAPSDIFDTGIPLDAKVYYLPGTMGWGTSFGVLPTAFWVLANPLILKSSPNFGVQSNGFGFTVSWATNASVVVEGGTNLTKPFWEPIQTNALTDGTFHFNDPFWTNNPRRFYRARSL